MKLFVILNVVHGEKSVITFDVNPQNPSFVHMEPDFRKKSHDEFMIVVRFLSKIGSVDYKTVDSQ